MVSHLYNKSADTTPSSQRAAMAYLRESAHVAVVPARPSRPSPQGNPAERTLWRRYEGRAQLVEYMLVDVLCAR